jgi:hypothetical protein
MEKVKVDTEIRKLDQLRSAHINQQHRIRWQVRSIPEDIERGRHYHAAYLEDIAMRDANDSDEFTMIVGNQTYSGKDARANAGEALNEVAYSWRNSQALGVRGSYRGFDILTTASMRDDGLPDLYVRGQATYKANLNLESPLGTIASIEHVVRNLDRRAEDEAAAIAGNEKTLADYKAQMDRPFEHTEHLKALLVKQAELNALLDLDKRDAQAVADRPDDQGEVVAPKVIEPFPTNIGPIHAPPVAVTPPTTQALAQAVGFGSRTVSLAPSP